ncbi:AAA family ATPase [Hugenholtzia roseola]|uniref:AAA family ATPase n=1 Tax=Hugenholtzia roseola TaxID=1002 RepID=UPI000421ACF9|nr:AAA family ATPase [Hugenholtzia roseola]
MKPHFYPPAIQSWGEILTHFSFLQGLSRVPQEPEYHAEGDVWTHTKMVVEALWKKERYQQAAAQEQAVLFYAALLHDLGKEICTQQDAEGRISSPKHALVGEHLVRSWLYTAPARFGRLSFFEREKICKLVRYHGLPLWILQKENPEKALFESSLQVCLQDLALIAEADVLGRICESQDELLERVAFFRLLAEEKNCYTSPKKFADAHTRFVYFYKYGESPADYPLYDDTEFEVILLCGLPASGKDTFYEQKLSHLPMVSLDAIRWELKVKPTDNQGIIIQEGQERAKKFLRKKQSFVWNATNLQRDRRKKLIDLFYTYKAAVRIVYVESPYEKLLQQNQNRKQVVPPAVIRRMAERMELPTLAEAHQVEYVV